jgi:peptidase E
MTKYILVGGYLHKAKDGGQAFFEELVKDFKQNKTVKILNCIFARPQEEWGSKFQENKKLFSKYINDFELILADPLKFIEQIRAADVIFFQGGYPVPLMKLLAESGDWIAELKGKTVAGTSAGAEIISKYYYICKTMRTGNGFGLLPIKFIPHWYSELDEYANINWKNALQELKDYQEDLPIYTLAEGEFKVFNTA